MPTEAFGVANASILTGFSTVYPVGGGDCAASEYFSGGRIENPCSPVAGVITFMVPPDAISMNATLALPCSDCNDLRVSKAPDKLKVSKAVSWNAITSQSDTFESPYVELFGFSIVDVSAFLERGEQLILVLTSEKRGWRSIPLGAATLNTVNFPHC